MSPSLVGIQFFFDAVEGRTWQWTQKKKLWLLLFVSPDNTAVGPCATSVALYCYFSLSKCCQVLNPVDKTFIDSCTGHRHRVYSSWRAFPTAVITTKCQRVPVTMLWHRRLGRICGGASSTSVLWSLSRRLGWLLAKDYDLIRLSLPEANNKKFQLDY